LSAKHEAIREEGGGRRSGKGPLTRGTTHNKHDKTDISSKKELNKSNPHTKKKRETLGQRHNQKHNSFVLQRGLEHQPKSR